MEVTTSNLNDICRLCQIAQTEHDEVELWDTPLLSSDNFLVVPALGQFVSGYLMIVAKDHILNTGLLSEQLYPELEALKNEVVEILKETFAKPIFFEHGPASQTQTGGCCIDHAHIHAIPAPVNLPSCLMKHFPYRSIRSIAELKDVAANRKPYLFVELSHTERYVFEVEIIPRQYLRQVVCAELGLSEYWDWRQYPFYDRIRQTVKRITRLRTESKLQGAPR